MAARSSRSPAQKAAAALPVHMNRRKANKNSITHGHIRRVRQEQIVEEPEARRDSGQQAGEEPDSIAG